MTTAELVQIDQETLAKMEYMKGSVAPISTELKITNEQEAQNANEFLVMIKTHFKYLEERRKEIKQPLLDATRQLDGAFNEVKDPLSSAEAVLTSALKIYRTEQMRIQREIEQKAIEAAKREEEKKRLALEVRAEKAEQKGQEEKAEALREQAESVYVTPLITTTTTKLAGTSFGSKWVAKIVDIKKIPTHFYLNSPAVIAEIQKVLNGFVKSKMPIAGVVYEEEVTMSTRTAR